MRLKEKLDSLAQSQLAVQNAVAWYRLTAGIGIPAEVERARQMLRVVDAQRESALEAVLAEHGEIQAKEAGNV